MQEDVTKATVEVATGRQLFLCDSFIVVIFIILRHLFSDLF
jgi:hypothetical protein